MFIVSAGLSAAALSEALGAVDRLVILRLKRYLRRLSACCAHGVEHFTRPIQPFASLLLARFPACRATSGIIFEIILGIKLLLTGSEYELFTAILADQHSVFKHFEQYFPSLFRSFVSVPADLVFCPTPANRRVRS